MKMLYGRLSLDDFYFVHLQVTILILQRSEMHTPLNVVMGYC